jgi:hypothetical protein
MSRRWLLSLLCLSATVVFVQLSAANNSASLRGQVWGGGGLRVNEPATRFLVYDYYNPEARAVVVPAMFVVR